MSAINRCHAASSNVSYDNGVELLRRENNGRDQFAKLSLEVKLWSYGKEVQSQQIQHPTFSNVFI